ncbi:MAG: thioredoxin fold domain-containing protein [Rhodoferax sp.]
MSIPSAATNGPLAWPVRRRLLLAAAVAGTATRLVAAAPVALLAAARSLPLELEQALQKGNPLVVMVSLDGCPFCHTVRQNYLAPLVREQGLGVVQVDMQSSQPLKDFQGAVTTHARMIQSWRIKIAPTVLFFGRGGTEVVERLTGASLPDFYGAYLDDRLQQARTSLRS